MLIIFRNAFFKNEENLTSIPNYLKILNKISMDE